MPVYLRGRMRPWSVTYCLSRLVFLKSSASSVKSIFGFGRGVRFSVGRRLPRLSLSVFVLRGILFNLLVQGVTAQKRIELLELQFLRLQFFVARGGVARRRLAFLARLAAFDGDDFACHKLFLFLDDLRLFWLFLVIRFNFRDADIVNRAELSEPALAQRAV